LTFPDIATGWLWLNRALLAAVAIGFFWKGTSRAVKVGVLLLILSTAGRYAWENGAGPALRWGSLFLGGIFATSWMALASWRHPRRMNFSPSGPDACPVHGRQAAEEWTKDFVVLGFQPAGDYITEWQLKGRKEYTWVRFFRHPSDPLWAEIAVLSTRGKIVARSVTSLKDNDCLMTVDAMADEEIFSGTNVRVQRLARRSSVRELVEKHKAWTMMSGGRFQPIPNPAEARRQAYDAWVDRLVSSGQVNDLGDQIAVRRSRVPFVALKTYTSWFH
jgi:hypothetical protein